MRGREKSGVILKLNKHIYNLTPNPHLTKICIELFYSLNCKLILGFNFQSYLRTNLLLKFYIPDEFLKHELYCSITISSGGSRI